MTTAGILTTIIGGVIVGLILIPIQIILDNKFGK